MTLPKVLVVDDDPDLATICSLVLESEGYDTDVATNGIEAYHTLASDDVDVVLLDVMMPSLDGITMCNMVKDDPRTCDVPVILMSASDVLCEKAKQSCADAVLAKPFDIEDLLATVGRFASTSE